MFQWSTRIQYSLVEKKPERLTRDGGVFKAKLSPFLSIVMHEPTLHPETYMKAVTQNYHYPRNATFQSSESESEIITKLIVLVQHGGSSLRKSK